MSKHDKYMQKAIDARDKYLEKAAKYADSNPKTAKIIEKAQELFEKYAMKSGGFKPKPEDCGCGGGGSSKPDPDPSKVKAVTFTEGNLTYQVSAYEFGGQFFAEIKVLDGFMDVKGLYLADDDFSGNSANLGGHANMNGTGVQWDTAFLLSGPGLQSGKEAGTFLKSGDSLVVNLSENPDVGPSITSLEDIVYIGVRAQSTSTGDSIKGVSKCPDMKDPDDKDPDDKDPDDKDPDDKDPDDKIKIKYDGCGCSPLVKDLSTLVPKGQDNVNVCDPKVKLTELEFVYIPSSEITNTQDGRASVEGQPDGDGSSFIVVSSKKPSSSGSIKSKYISSKQEVNEGETFSVSGTKKDGTFESNTYFLVYDSEAAFNSGDAPLQTIQVHTSCSRPLFIGDQFGSIGLTKATNVKGETFEGGFQDATYEIIGGKDGDKFEVDQETGILKWKEKPEFDPDGTNEYSVKVKITATDGQTETFTIYVDVTDPLEDAIIVDAGDTFVTFVDIEVPCNKDAGFDFCTSKTKPIELSFLYDPSNILTNAQDGRAEVKGEPDEDGSSFIVVSRKEWKPNLNDKYVQFKGNVEEGETYTFTGLKKDGEFDSNTYFAVFDSEEAFLSGESPLQQVQVHTSCSRPLAISDQFGSFKLVGAKTRDGSVFGGDGDPDDVTYSIVDGPHSDLFEINPVTGKLSFKEAADPAILGRTEFNVTVRATNNQDPSCFAEQVICVVIEGEIDADCPKNNPPIAVDDFFETEGIDEPFIGNVLKNDFDPDDDPIEVLLFTQPANGTVEMDKSTGTFTYTPDAGFFGKDTFKYVIIDDKNAASEVATVKIIVPCFAAGTLIATADGLKPVEEIRPGDRVLTRDDGYQPVRWAGQRALDAGFLASNPDFASVMIKAGALGNNLPRRDLRVSPGHRMLMSGERAELMFGERDVLVAASDLVGQPGISLDPRPVTYVHIMFDRHQVIDSEGAWSESFQPADVTLNGLDDQQREELLALFPELGSRKGQRGYAAARRVLASHEANLLMSA